MVLGNPSVKSMQNNFVDSEDSIYFIVIYCSLGSSLNGLKSQVCSRPDILEKKIHPKIRLIKTFCS